MNPDYVGLFLVIGHTPVWGTVLFVLLFATPLGFIFVVADRTSMFTNVSYSGVLGAISMVVVVLIGATVVQRGAPLPPSLMGISGQVVWAVACFGVGIRVGLYTPWLPNRWPDLYYYLVGGPVGAFLAVPMALATFYNGDRAEKTASAVLAVIWLGLVAYDWYNQRLDQPEWIWRRHGIRWVRDRFVCRKP